jgi:serine/threonine protein kinase
MVDEEALRLRWATTIRDSADPTGATLPVGATYRPTSTVTGLDTTRLEVRGLEVGGVAPPPAPRRDAPAPASYEVGRELGRGGMGVVYQARQVGLARDVALKQVLAGRDGAADLERFVAEARTTGFLEHPNVVPVHELARTAEGHAFLAMKLVSGVSWKQLLRPAEGTRGAPDLVRHLEVLLQVCNAVAFAHTKGVIHRDIKPENVMVGDFGEVFLVDWGLAVAFRDGPAAELAPHRSTVRSPGGTPSYMAPEQVLDDGEALGPWTDVYLLGAPVRSSWSAAPRR